MAEPASSVFSSFWLFIAVWQGWLRQHNENKCSAPSPWQLPLSHTARSHAALSAAEGMEHGPWYPGRSAALAVAGEALWDGTEVWVGSTA